MLAREQKKKQHRQDDDARQRQFETDRGLNLSDREAKYETWCKSEKHGIEKLASDATWETAFACLQAYEEDREVYHVRISRAGNGWDRWLVNDTAEGSGEK